MNLNMQTHSGQRQAEGAFDQCQALSSSRKSAQRLRVPGAPAGEPWAQEGDVLSKTGSGPGRGVPRSPGLGALRIGADLWLGLRTHTLMLGTVCLPLCS